MRSSYDEAQTLTYKIQTAIKEKKNEMVFDTQSQSISQDPLAAAGYLYGLIKAFEAVEDLIKYVGDKEMADLINEDREFERTTAEYKQLKEIYGKQKDCAKCIHCETALEYEPCASCMSCMTEYKPNYKEG